VNKTAEGEAVVTQQQKGEGWRRWNWNGGLGDMRTHLWRQMWII